MGYLDFHNRFLTLTLAIILDLLLGDPPSRFHPVAWMGKAIGVASKRAPRTDGSQNAARRSLSYGLGLAIGGIGITVSLCQVLLYFLNRLPSAVRNALVAIILKQTFAVSGLLDAAEAVQYPLSRGDISIAREQLGWHLVSRDTVNLREDQVAAATIESIAENASDSVIAPMLAFMLGGLPLAAAYRFVNTADAMLGYRDPDREWLGKAAARLDDFLNLVPSRLTAGLLIVAALLSGENARQAWNVWRNDGRSTESPNAGQPMSAMAGALNLELAKEGHYSLGRGLHQARSGDILRSLTLTKVAIALFVFLLAMVSHLAKNRPVPPKSVSRSRTHKG